MDIYEVTKSFLELCKNPSQVVNLFYTYSLKLYQDLKDKPGIRDLISQNHPALAGWAYLGLQISEKFPLGKENLEEKIKFSVGQDLLRYH